MVCGEWRVMGDGKTDRRQGDPPSQDTLRATWIEVRDVFRLYKR